jgi:5-methylcytosine-specific restriction endonuclease McrA
MTQKDRREYMREYRKTHLSYFKAYMRGYKRHRSERELEHTREYKQTSQYRTYNKEYLKKWKAQNPEKQRLYKHERRARLAGNGGTYTVDEIIDLFYDQAGYCYYCGTPLYSSKDGRFHADHKVPVSRGGDNFISNIALACSKCNLTKNNKTEEEFLATLT